ncbi:hypothetical protein PMZ80_004135 [Knufia obscura]|uniref:Uncharacterized protein n=2 Tax=Knufia TaxID=430999 RepID=A0AAN8F0D4_9EURO|nr:hypothetical protein PMZ80_004135 [Knufia obscura]KAK5949271.1 hypothetical protein OHC33_009624 [Knufia fluminis]
MFALPFLERLKEAIDELPDPATESFGLTSTFDDFNVQSSQDDISAIDSQDQGFKKPPSNRGLNAELWNMIQALQRELDQQRQDAKDRENSLGIQLEQQRKESEQERKGLQVQQKDWENQQKELMDVLKQQIQQQNEQIKQLLQQR